MPGDRICLDHQATTPVDERVMEAMLPYFARVYGNAASNDHLFGVKAKLVGWARYEEGLESPRRRRAQKARSDWERSVRRVVQRHKAGVAE